MGFLTYGGYWLDRRLHTLPLFLLLGLFGGFAIALYHLIKEVHGGDEKRQGGNDG